MEPTNFRLAKERLSLVRTSGGPSGVDHAAIRKQSEIVYDRIPIHRVLRVGVPVAPGSRLHVDSTSSNLRISEPKRCHAPVIEVPHGAMVTGSRLQNRAYQIAFLV